MPEMNSDLDAHAVPNAALTQLQLALREQQIILDTAGVGIVFVRKRLVIRCNQRFAQMYGYGDVAEIVGSANLSLYPDQTVFDELEESALPVMTKGLVYKTELQMKRREGQLFWAHLTGQLVNPLDIEEGSIWIIDDISEQKLAQEQLQSVLSEQNLILDNAMVGIVFFA
jgi:PAS domain S-box-containing protein